MKENKKGGNYMKKVLKTTVAVAGVAAIAGVAYATYKYFKEGDNPCHRCSCNEDWDDDDDWDDDFEDDDFFECNSEKEDVKEEKESPISIKVE